MNKKKIIGIVLAVLLILSGIFHFVAPEVYFPLTPDFMSKYILNYLAGGAELLLGIGVFIPAYRKLSLLGISLLMVAFLPVHIWDAAQDEPFVGSKINAYSRIVMQFALIYLPLWARKD
ncbi:MAG: hypothetical protein AB8B56_00610 [Crocinitomicaceae bacterium]